MNIINFTEPCIAVHLRGMASGDWLDRIDFKVRFNPGRDSNFIDGTNLIA